MSALPHLLSDFTPAPGLIKADYTDFVVEELPLYEPDGSGTHTYFLLEKAGLSTDQATHDLARALNVRKHEIGFAGLKDSRAVTRQWMSVEHVDPHAIQTLDLPRMRVLDVTRHRNKLRLGHLRGNHFTIKVRQTEPDRLAELQDALAELTRRGVPNYFGVQRFGYRGDTWQFGQALLRNDIDTLIDRLLGHPLPEDYGDIRLARELYDRGEYGAAARAWPKMFRTERRALRAMERARGKHRRAYATIDRSTRNFYISAYQSFLFNHLLARRIPTGLDRLWTGDLAWRHANGAVFRVEDATREQPRADAFEISPSGPLFGFRMSQPTGPAGELEAELLAREELESDAFHHATIRVKGGRRPLRFPVEHARLALGADRGGAYLELQFTLPRGCYATSLLRELFDVEHQTSAAGGRHGDTEDPSD